MGLGDGLEGDLHRCAHKHGIGAMLGIVRDKVDHYAKVGAEFQKYLADNYIIPLGISGDEAVRFIKRWQSVTTWLLYDSGATNISPENFGIPRIEDFE